MAGLADLSDLVAFVADGPAAAFKDAAEATTDTHSSSPCIANLAYDICLPITTSDCVTGEEDTQDREAHQDIGVLGQAGTSALDVSGMNGILETYGATALIVMLGGKKAGSSRPKDGSVKAARNT